MARGLPGLRAPGDLFARRDLLLLLVQKELKIKYKGAALGFLWSLLNPILMTLVYTFVFGIIARFTIPRYPIFLLAGLMPWNAFVIGVTSSTTSVTGNAHLVGRVRFPLAFLPLTTVLANLVNLLPSLGVLLVLAALFRQPLGPPLLALPVLLLLQTAFTSGLALLLSGVAVYFRDVEYLAGIGMTVWFFLTPVVYPLSAVTGVHLRPVLLMNPLTWLITGYQRIWHDDGWPDGTFVLLFAAAALLALAAGSLVFRRLQARLPEEL